MYFNVIRFLVHYPQAWSIPLAGFTLLLGAGVVASAFAGAILRLSGLALGLVVLPAGHGCCGAASHLTWTVILALHPGGVWLWSTGLRSSGSGLPA